MYDDAVSYRDCFLLISTLLQDLVDPWRVKMIYKQSSSGSDDGVIEL